MQKAIHSGGGDANGKCASNPRTTQNSVLLNHPMNKQAFARKNSIGLQKLKEYPKCESQNSSVETLPSSGTGTEPHSSVLDSHCWCLRI